MMVMFCALTPPNHLNHCCFDLEARKPSFTVRINSFERIDYID